MRKQRGREVELVDLRPLVEEQHQVVRADVRRQNTKGEIQADRPDKQGLPI
jgi:hypothetical protein